MATHRKHVIEALQHQRRLLVMRENAREKMAARQKRTFLMDSCITKSSNFVRVCYLFLDIDGLQTNTGKVSWRSHL